MDSEKQDDEKPPIIKVTSVEQGKEVIAEHPVVIFGYFVDVTTDIAKAFFTTAGQVDDKFALVTAPPDDDDLLYDLGGVDQEIVLWKNGINIFYKGDSIPKDIITWLEQKTAPPIEVASSDQAKEVIATHSIVVFGYFTDRNTDRAKTFLAVAAEAHEEVFAIVSDNKIIAELEAEDQDIVMFKDFDDHRVKYESEELTGYKLKTWLVVQRTPIMSELIPSTFGKDFYDVFIKHTLHLFLSKKNGDIEKYVEQLRPVARRYRSRNVTCCFLDVDEEDSELPMRFLGVHKGEAPCIRLFEHKPGRSSPLKYKPPNDALSPEAVQEMVESFFAGKLKPHLKSQALPADWDRHPVKVLVASNFDEVVFDRTKKVLVAFCTPWCPPCKDLEPVYQQLGEHYEKADDVLIAKLDGDANELEHTNINRFPIILLYTKDNQVFEFQTKWDRTLENLMKFVETDGAEGAEPRSSTPPADSKEGSCVVGKGTGIVCDSTTCLVTK